MAINKVWTLCLLALTSQLLLANEHEMKANSANKKMPLTQVFDKLTEETGVRIHYSALPTNRFSELCVGSTVQQVMDYLSDKKIDFVVRTSPESIRKAFTHHDQNRQPEEIWILGAFFAGDQSVLTYFKHCTASPAQPNQATTTSAGAELIQAEPNEISELVERLATGNATERADTLAFLAVADEKENASIDNALNNALSDSDATVRAQAVFNLVKRDGDSSAMVLQTALQDKEAGVRLMAVDSAGDNEALLQQALTDSDETVRALAEIKLEALSNDKGYSRR